MANALPCLAVGEGQGRVTTILAQLAKLGVAGSWGVEIIYSLEILPTGVR